jgi:hypothetical protein
MLGMRILDLTCCKKDRVWEFKKKYIIVALTCYYKNNGGLNTLQEE